MQSIVLNLSEMDLNDRLTVEHYVSPDLAIMQQLENGGHPLDSLGDLAIVKGGKRLPSNAQYSSVGIPYVRVVDFGLYEIELDNAVYISEKLHEGIERYQLRYDDIGIVIVGATIGKVAIYKSITSPCNFNENLARITVKSEVVNPDYLLAFLQSRYGQAYISWLTGGAAQAKLSLERILRIRVPLPPRPLQDRIAQIMQDAYATRQAKLTQAQQLLDDLDDFVLRELEINLTELESHRSAIKPIKNIVGGRFDFEAVVTIQALDFNGIEPTPLGQIVQQINSRVTPAETLSDETINYIGLGNIESNTGQLKGVYSISGSQIFSSSPTFKQGDILYGRMRPYLNKVWIAEFDGVCSGEAIVLRLDQNKVDVRFLHTLLLSKLTLNQVIPLQSGTSLPRVSASDVLSIKLPISKDINQQKRIGNEIEKIREQAKKLGVAAENIVSEAQLRVERMILGEGA